MLCILTLLVAGPPRPFDHSELNNTESNVTTSVPMTSSDKGIHNSKVPGQCSHVKKMWNITAQNGFRQCNLS